MKPILIPHNEYQNFVLEQLQKHYTGDVLVLVKNDWPTISKLWITDLSYLTSWLRSSYSNRGPAPRDPASMMRSYLLLLQTNPTMSITRWVDVLYRTPLYAFLSGFEPKDIPGVGTFYDFFTRLWGSEDSNGKPRIKPKRQKQKKEKAEEGRKSGSIQSRNYKKINRPILSIWLKKESVTGRSIV
jgi:hypothetical protein